MDKLKVIQTFSGIDMRNIWRDELLSWILGMPVVVALLIRWGLPLILETIGDYLEQDLLSHIPVLAGYFILLIAPMAAGMIVGFLMLDQRDNNTYTVIKVTPISTYTYFLYTLLMPLIAGFLITFISFYIAGLGNVGFAGILISSLVASMLSPLSGLTMAVFAENKVQGFALIKGSIILWIPPIIAYFMKPAWEIVFGLDPLYWPCKIYQGVLIGSSFNWVYVLSGALYIGNLIFLLLRRFRKIM
ncbi:MAG: hypothetical protein ACLFPF_08225 [Halanaerobiales bacterium]